MVSTTSSSFYTDGEQYAEADVVPNDYTPPNVPSQAPSSLYPNGTAYDALANVEDVVAEINGLLAQTHTTADASAASAAASQASANASHTSEVNAAASDTDAIAQASTATTQAGIATTQAGNSATSAAASLASQNAAHTSEVNAAASASTATTQAGIATTKAGDAATSASQALASKNAAGTSETNAGTSEANALASKNAAATSASNAATSEGNALTYKNAANTSAGNAATSEANALSSKNAAATSATNAATSETNALASKNAAATSATNAATSETNAGNSATAAAGSATSALNYLKSFRDVYYGGLSADPSVDPDGNAPTSGDFYYHTSLFKFRSYNGSAWVDMVGSGGGNTTAQYALAAADGTLPNSRVLTNSTGGINWDFTTAGQIKATLAQGYVRYDGANGLTAAQQSQARSNIGVEKKNYILNGAMMVSQQNGATAGSVSQYYAADQFANGTITNGTYTVARVNSTTPAGSPNRFRVTVTAAATSVAAGDIFYIWQRIEGLRAADLLFGTANAKTITLRFGVRAPAGTYCITISNGDNFSRSYVAEYTISAANTDTNVSITIPGDVTGTWNTDSTTGINVFWALMSGSSFQRAAGSWGSGTVAYVASSNQFNLMGTSGNVFELFDVGLYEGSVAPAFTVPDFQKELAACQRYWYPIPAQAFVFPAPGATYAFAFRFDLKVSMRAIPTVVTSYNSLSNCNAGQAGTRTTESIVEQVSALAAGNASFGFTATCSARL